MECVALDITTAERMVSYRLFSLTALALDSAATAGGTAQLTGHSTVAAIDIAKLTTSLDITTVPRSPQLTETQMQSLWTPPQLAGH